MTRTKILLTGAGFTHNFGLPLARHVWGMIFNDPNIQKAKQIREIFRIIQTNICLPLGIKEISLDIEPAKISEIFDSV